MRSKAFIAKIYFTKIPSSAQALNSLPPLGKIPPTPSPSHKQQQFSCYNPINTSFLAVVVAPVPFPFFFHAGHTNFGFIDVQYLQNGVFRFEKGLNGQNHS